MTFCENPNKLEFDAYCLSEILNCIRALKHGVAHRNVSLILNSRWCVASTTQHGLRANLHSAWCRDYAEIKMNLKSKFIFLKCRNISA